MLQNPLIEKEELERKRKRKRKSPTNPTTPQLPDTLPLLLPNHMPHQPQIQHQALQPRAQTLHIADDLDQVPDKEAAMDGMDRDLDVLDPVEGRVWHLDAEVALQVLAVRARVVAVEVVVVEHGPGFGVDVARGKEDGDGEGFVAP